MKSILAGCLVCLLVACASSLSPSARSAGHLLIGKDRYLPGSDFESEWAPSDTDISSLEAALARRLAREDAQLSDYMLRFAAVTRKGRRFLVGDACREDMPNSKQFLMPPGEDSAVLHTFGGGSAFFRFRYDANAQRLIEFTFNALL